MSKSKKRLAEAQKQTEKIVSEANKKIEELGEHSSHIYDRLEALQNQFNKISNKPHELKVQCEELEKIRLNWKQQVDKIEKDYETTKLKAGIGGGIGAGIGGAVVGLGPSAAMGVATTFGVASTGTAISSLSGAAATNAALAWLGGGTLAAGGGGMAAGNAFLALAGPIGWAIAGVSIFGSGVSLLAAVFDKIRLEDIYCLISKRDEKKYKLAIVEINERIARLVDESDKLETALERTVSFGIDYASMAEEQQYELGSYVNFMNSSTQFLVNPILGLQPNYTEADLDVFISEKYSNGKNFFSKYKSLVVSMCNLLYKIPLDEYDVKVLNKSFEKNKKFLEATNITKKEFAANDVVNKINQALKYKYNNQKERNDMNNLYEKKNNDFQKKIEEWAQRIEKSNEYDETTKENIIRDLMELKEERLNIMITGGTGCGKSSTINALFKTEKAVVGTGPDPETMDIQKYDLDNLTLWDTPGLGDGVEADERHKRKIIDLLHKTDDKGNMLIDLVLVIIDGSNRVLKTEFDLINDVIIPNLGDNPEKRILIAINKADAAMSGRGWDYEKYRPTPKLTEFLNEKAASVRERIQKSTGVDVETIYYSAGFKEEGQPQEPSYNMLKLLYYILKFTPDEKIPLVVVNVPDEPKVVDSGDEDYTEQINKEVKRSKIFQESFVSAVEKGGDIGKEILGAPGKLLGTVIGGAAGLVVGGFKALFSRKKK